MNLNSVLDFLALVGALMLFAGAGLAVYNAGQNHSARPGILLAIFGLIIGVVFFIASLGLVTVEATEVAVVFQSVGGDATKGSLWPQPLKSGVHIIVPVIN